MVDTFEFKKKIFSKSLTNMELRREIESFGDKPGPITKTTRQLYEMRLNQLRLNGPKIEKLNNSFNAATKGFSCELIDALNGHVDFADDSIEISMATCFLMNNENWREGHSKSCFNYMLIDPRVSDNLPGRAKFLGLSTDCSDAMIRNTLYKTLSLSISRSVGSISHIHCIHILCR